MPFRTAQIRLVSSHPEVYEPCDDSFLVVDALLADRTNLLEHRPTLCMEVGCGSGYVLTTLALLLGQDGTIYIGTDITPIAVRVTSETLEAHGVQAELINTDIASGLVKRLAGLVDVMVVNPPYVPTPEKKWVVLGLLHLGLEGRMAGVLLIRSCLLIIFCQIGVGCTWSSLQQTIHRKYAFK